MMYNKIVILTFLVLIQVSILAQEPEEKAIDNVFKGTKFINLQSANTVDKYHFNLVIQHRFGDISGGFYELFGLDQSSSRIGFEYGIFNNLTIGIGRSSFLKTFDSYLKYRILTQTTSFPITLTATVSGSVPTLRDYFPDEYNSFSEKVSGNAQLHIAKSWKYFGFQVSPGYIGTGYILEENDSYSFFTLAFGGSAKLSKNISFNLEYLYRFENEIDLADPLSASIDIKAGGHLFQIMISNTQQMYDQGIIATPPGDWTKGNLYLGFNLIRTFNFKQYE